MQLKVLVFLIVTAGLIAAGAAGVYLEAQQSPLLPPTLPPARQTSVASVNGALMLTADNAAITLQAVRMLDDVAGLAPGASGLLVLDIMLHNQGERRLCFYDRDFPMRVADEETYPQTAYMRAVRDRDYPERAYPDFLNGQCLEAGESAASLLVYNMVSDIQNLILSLYSPVGVYQLWLQPPLTEFVVFGVYAGAGTVTVTGETRLTPTPHATVKATASNTATAVTITDTATETLVPTRPPTDTQIPTPVRISETRASEPANTATPTIMPTFAPSATATSTATATQTTTSTPTLTDTATSTRTPKVTPTATAQPSRTFTPTATATAQQQVFIGGGGEFNINIRNAPTTDSTILTSLSRGTAVTVLEERQTSDGERWYRVEYAIGESGWVLAALTETQQP